MTREQILQAFDDIRVWQRGDKRAPHKPLLILLALGYLQRGDVGELPFPKIEAQLKKLLDDFGPSGSSSSRHYPFWHLRTDGNGAIWHLSGPEQILNRPAGATPNLSELRDYQVRGGFAGPVREALANDSGLASEVANRILRAHFPETMHEDILDAVGLDIGLDQATDDPQSELRHPRDPSFRIRVLRAYEQRCCVCGHDLRLGTALVGVEAAHIKWFQAGGPDVEPNGLALCSLHHKLFDYGVFTLLPGSCQIVFSEDAVAGEDTKARLLAHHGASIILPIRDECRPNPDFLAWHEQQVFKGPKRSTS